MEKEKKKPEQKKQKKQWQRFNHPVLKNWLHGQTCLTFMYGAYCYLPVF